MKKLLNKFARWLLKVSTVKGSLKAIEFWVKTDEPSSMQYFVDGKITREHSIVLDKWQHIAVMVKQDNQKGSTIWQGQKK